MRLRNVSRYTVSGNVQWFSVSATTTLENLSPKDSSLPKQDPCKTQLPSSLPSVPSFSHPFCLSLKLVSINNWCESLAFNEAGARGIRQLYSSCRYLLRVTRYSALFYFLFDSLPWLLVLTLSPWPACISSGEILHITFGNYAVLGETFPHIPA